jgi:hypothetical protein
MSDRPGSFNPYHFRRDIKERARGLSFAEQAQAALNTPQARAFLEELQRREEARPSYEPGLPFDTVAWREGRKALLRQIVTALNTALPEHPHV